MSHAIEGSTAYSHMMQLATQYGELSDRELMLLILDKISSVEAMAADAYTQVEPMIAKAKPMLAAFGL